METSFQLWGSAKNLPERKIVKAGVLSAVLESGSLRTISVGSVEIIRMIYSAVRTEGWLTVEPEILEERITPLHDGFAILLKCRYRNNDAHFEAVYTITGRNDNSLVFTMDGVVKSTFKRCRIGFCVLHPPDGITGKPCTIIHPDGQVEQTAFPQFVDPGQPFFNIKGMKWDMENLGTVELDFEGDIFETEDHRNWTDASFKTYCTPLSLHYPVEVKEGTTIRQTVSLKFTPFAELKLNDQSNSVKIEIDYNKSYPLPEIGLGESTSRKSLTSNEIDFLKLVKFNHYRVDVYTFKKGWQTALSSSVTEAKLMEVQLELAVFFDHNCGETARELAELLIKESVQVERIIVFHRTISSTPDELWNQVLPVLSTQLPNTKLVAGTNANFAQINRARPSFNNFDELSFSVQPQEHAFDNLTLVENISAQFDVVNSARQFSKGKPVIVSPVNIQRRFNANKEHFEQPTLVGEMPWQVDTRLLSLFGAVWTAGSLAHLTKARAASVTFFETVGERGIMQGDFASRWPEKFPAETGQLFPVFHILRILNRWKNNNFSLFWAESSNKPAVQALLLKGEKVSEGMIYNFTALPKSVEISMNCHSVSVIRMNGKTYDSFSKNPFFTDILDELIPAKNGHFTIELMPFEIFVFKQSEAKN